MYFEGDGSSIHDNFFGRTLSGYSAQIIVPGNGLPTLITNNVFYGSYAAGMVFWEGENAVITGNVFITHPAVLARHRSAGDDAGMRLYYTPGNVTVSGNYIEGTVKGLSSLSRAPRGKRCREW